MATLAISAQREDLRYPVSLDVDYTARDAFYANHVNNISRGGMFIATERPLPLRSEIDITLKLPQGGGAIHARGRVAWNYDMRKGTLRVVAGMGIKFTDISPADFRRLTELLDTLETEH